MMERPFNCPPELEKYRQAHPIARWLGDETNGALYVAPKGLAIMFSDGHGWEHVSVSRSSRCPDWEDMCWVKEQFWGPGALVVQFHPPRSEYVNCHPFCLHLWRPINAPMPAPPSILVGPKP